ncbi:hypothetical protein Airi02_014620 [Actinoallomurus iriomotensis]|uniref:Uncharacterized protein n=1 Tax=Actinoallomurus iriomotensis TaxID=478107 RepID=A0A9W6S0I2_9ACTN|nr:hypothetical protein Airi02_014620 [Actinoallomurus iriomotensis]
MLAEGMLGGVAPAGREISVSAPARAMTEEMAAKARLTSFSFCPVFRPGGAAGRQRNSRTERSVTKCEKL